MVIPRDTTQFKATELSLPCKHVLKRAFDTGEPIPRSLVHPRYWLQGPIMHEGEWQPRYPEEARVDYE